MTLVATGIAVFACTLVAVMVGARLSRPSQPAGATPVPTPPAVVAGSEVVDSSPVEDSEPPPPPLSQTSNIAAFRGLNEEFDVLSVPHEVLAKIPEKNRLGADEFYDELRREFDDSEGA